MLRVVIASFLFALGLLRMIQYVTFTKNREPADGTSLLGGRWNVGALGTRTFLVLRALSGIGFVAAGVLLLAGWIERALSIFLGAAIFELLPFLIGILITPALGWGALGCLVALAFVFTVTLGVMWLEPHVAGWFAR